MRESVQLIISQNLKWLNKKCFPIIQLASYVKKLWTMNYEQHAGENTSSENKQLFMIYMADNMIVRNYITVSLAL